MFAINEGYVRHLTPQRLKALKRSQYGKLGLVRHKCECGCGEMFITDQEGYETLMSNIGIISAMQRRTK